VIGVTGSRIAVTSGVRAGVRAREAAGAATSTGWNAESGIDAGLPGSKPEAALAARVREMAMTSGATTLRRDRGAPVRTGHQPDIPGAPGEY
jgi:hypothetical protein